MTNRKPLTCTDLQTVQPLRSMVQHVATLSDGRQYSVDTYPGSRVVTITDPHSGRTVSKYTGHKIHAAVRAKLHELGIVQVIEPKQEGD
jgi:hypothetical protein